MTCFGGDNLVLFDQLRTEIGMWEQLLAAGLAEVCSLIRLRRRRSSAPTAYFKPLRAGDVNTGRLLRIRATLGLGPEHGR